MLNLYKHLIDGIFTYIIETDWIFLLICMSLVLSIVHIIYFAIWGRE